MLQLSRIATYIAVVIGLCALAGCNTTGRSVFSSPGNSGVTDEPAAGFKKIIPGSEEDYIMQAGRRIYFTAGSNDLDDVARETLDIQSQWLRKYPQWLIKLQGHADDSRRSATNIALSDKRAKVVMEYLAQQGVAPHRMWVKGYGSERLVRKCGELECKALNRRVVVNLRKQYDAAAPQFKKKSG